MKTHMATADVIRIFSSGAIGSGTATSRADSFDVIRLHGAIPFAIAKEVPDTERLEIIRFMLESCAKEIADYKFFRKDLEPVYAQLKTLAHTFKGTEI